MTSTGFGGLTFADADPWVVWGSGSTPETGQGNYNEVTFEILPPPSVPGEAFWSIVVLGMTLLVTLALGVVLLVRYHETARFRV